MLKLRFINKLVGATSIFHPPLYRPLSLLLLFPLSLSLSGTHRGQAYRLYAFPRAFVPKKKKNETSINGNCFPLLRTSVSFLLFCIHHYVTSHCEFTERGKRGEGGERG